MFDPATVTFATWLQQTAWASSQIYWIQGKPGSGKSTLMKFGMRDPRFTELLSLQDSDDNISAMSRDVPTNSARIVGDTATWIVAAFFFHDRGSESEKTMGGMLQAVLKSVLDQVPALVSFVIPVYTTLAHAQRTRNPTWDFETLRSALLAILCQRQVRVNIILFLDALDEKSGDKEQLVSLLEEILRMVDNRYVRLKICLASRPWSIFAEHFGGCQGFAIQDFTKQDINTYAIGRLRSASRSILSPAEEVQLAGIIELVNEKALGVFIWVRLVVDIIVKGIHDGTPLTSLELQAREMPQELEDLYTQTI